MDQNPCDPNNMGDYKACQGPTQCHYNHCNGEYDNRCKRMSSHQYHDRFYCKQHFQEISSLASVDSNTASIISSFLTQKDKANLAGVTSDVTAERNQERLAQGREALTAPFSQVILEANPLIELCPGGTEHELTYCLKNWGKWLTNETIITRLNAEQLNLIYTGSNYFDSRGQYTHEQKNRFMIQIYLRPLDVIFKRPMQIETRKISIEDIKDIIEQNPGWYQLEVLREYTNSLVSDPVKLPVPKRSRE